MVEHRIIYSNMDGFSSFPGNLFAVLENKTVNRWPEKHHSKQQVFQSSVFGKLSK